MARLLVKAIDYTHFDPEVDRQGAYKRGDIVGVMPDDHVWSPLEGLPTFEQIDLPGVSVSEVEYLCNSEVQTLDEITSVALRKNKRLLRLVSRTKERKTKTRRRYRVDLDNANQLIDKVRV